MEVKGRITLEWGGDSEICSCEGSESARREVLRVRESLSWWEDEGQEWRGSRCLLLGGSLRCNAEEWGQEGGEMGEEHLALGQSS